MSRKFSPDGSGSSSYDYNIQYSPEKCGLELIAELETAGSYEFCTTLVFRDIETGDVLIAQDSGCSCPTPFADFTSTGDLIPYQDEAQLRRLITDHHHAYSRELSASEVVAFLRRVREAVKARLQGTTMVAHICESCGETSGLLVPAENDESDEPEQSSLADVHEELENAMIVAGVQFLEKQDLGLPGLESLREYDEWAGDERVQEYHEEGPFSKFRWATGLAITDAIGHKGGA